MHTNERKLIPACAVHAAMNVIILNVLFTLDSGVYTHIYCTLHAVYKDIAYIHKIQCPHHCI